MTCIETFATLRVFSETLPPEIVGQRLQIEATEKLPRDPSSPYRPRRETNYWGWCTRGRIESTDNAEHVCAVIDLLKDKRGDLDELRSAGCVIDVCCYWVSTGQGGPSLDVPMMRSLCDLGLDIWWDVYFSDDAET